MLCEVFSYEYAEIAEIIGSEETACRQVFSRAKKHIAVNRPRFKVDPEAHHQMLNRFIQAATSGELDGLMQLLAEDVTLWTDGGGKTRGAASHPLHGRDAVARFILGSIRLVPAKFHVETAEVNGELAVIVRAGDGVTAVLSISVDRGQVTEIRAMANPDKLKWVNGNNGESEGVAQ